MLHTLACFTCQHASSRSFYDTSALALEYKRDLLQLYKFVFCLFFRLGWLLVGLFFQLNFSVEVVFEVREYFRSVLWSVQEEEII